MSKAVVLLSGGMDSTVVLGLACWSYDEVHALSFYYGQRHSNELGAAKRIALMAGVTYHTGMIDPSVWKQTVLCGAGRPPEGRSLHAIRNGGISTTFVPGRNVVLLSHALALAGMLGGADVLIGATREDVNGYPDCRAEFLTAFEDVARTALPGCQIAVHAPLIGMTKRQVAELGQAMAIDFAQTWSCYQPQYHVGGVQPCGRCDACVLRAAALAP